MEGCLVRHSGVRRSWLSQQEQRSSRLDGSKSVPNLQCFTPPTPSESPPQSPPPAPASSPLTPLPPSPALALRCRNTAPPRAHFHPTLSQPPQSPSARPAPARTESSPAPAHSEFFAETLSDRPPDPPTIFHSARQCRPAAAPSTTHRQWWHRHHEK